jgi:hypothetical protein
MNRREPGLHFPAARENTGKVRLSGKSSRFMANKSIDLGLPTPTRRAGWQGNSREGKSKRTTRGFLAILLHRIRFVRDRKMARFGPRRPIPVLRHDAGRPRFRADCGPFPPSLRNGEPSLQGLPFAAARYRSAP